MTDMDSTLETEAKTKQGGMPEYEPADHEAEEAEVEEPAEEAEEPAEEHPGGLKTTDPTFADGAQEVDSHPWNPPAEG